MLNFPTPTLRHYTVAGEPAGVTHPFEVYATDDLARLQAEINRLDLQDRRGVLQAFAQHVHRAHRQYDGYFTDWTAATVTQHHRYKGGDLHARDVVLTNPGRTRVFAARTGHIHGGLTPHDFLPDLQPTDPLWALRDYFGAVAHPVIEQVFIPGSGWQTADPAGRSATRSRLVVLRRRGVTCVAVRHHDRVADFTITELLTVPCVLHQAAEVLANARRSCDPVTADA